MAVERSTKAQVAAYRFGVRRVEHALATGATYRPGLLGPRHGLSLVIGLVVAGLLTAGFAVYGFLKPAPAIGDAKVLVDSDSGSAFVIRDGVAHPAMNLASAMLAAAGDATAPPGGTGSEGPSGSGTTGAPAATPTVRKVTTATLATLPKGQLLGIPGAPGQVPANGALATNTWQVCDQLGVDPAAAPGTTATLTTTVVVGGPGAAPSEGAAFLASADGGVTAWLIAEGRRARVDMRDSALSEGLGLRPDAVRRISLGLLNALPEGKPIERPSIPHEGNTVRYGAAAFTVGEIVRVVRASGDVGLYLALEDGPQPVPAVVADVVRAVTGQGGQVRVVPPASIANARPTASPLPTDAYPAERPKVLDVRAAPGLCLDWRIVGDTPTIRIDPITTLPLPAGARAVPAPPSGDKAARGRIGVADQVYVPPGSGLAIGQTAVGAAATSGALFLLTDQGMAFPVVSPAAMTALGLTSITPAPPELVSLLPLGPTLDPVAARRYFDESAGAGP